MRIFVEGLEFVGAHGVYAEERAEGRRFQADLAVEVSDLRAADSDALDDTLDYRGLAQIVIEVANGPSRSLLERLASEMLDAALSRYPQVVRAEVTLRKLATGVPGDPRWVGVSLTRSR